MDAKATQPTLIIVPKHIDSKPAYHRAELSPLLFSISTYQTSQHQPILSFTIHHSDPTEYSKSLNLNIDNILLATNPFPKILGLNLFLGKTIKLTYK